ncbi:MAG: hypothetical protein JSV12_06725 [Candidatus Bathyarchaeota archaeon]|nr:MAG: hypothetical protein JSV12_06725 [Candidatus Bathyarchaeota archaeon]
MTVKLLKKVVAFLNFTELTGGYSHGFVQIAVESERNNVIVNEEILGTL